MGQVITLNDKDIVLYALYSLGGFQNRIHTEDIALKCYELAPSRFSWTKYPQYPDIQPVRFALEKCKPLIIGGSERKQPSKITGWRLTDKGIKWLETNLTRIENQLRGKQSPNVRLVDTRRMKSLMNSLAYKKFIVEGENAEIYHAGFAESITCTVNTKPDVLSERLEQIYSMANMLKQDEVKEYVDFCRRRFSKQIGSI
ncbi:hypothetical protein ACFLWZ_02135 [Chloroflexota bacterium]